MFTRFCNSAEVIERSLDGLNLSWKRTVVGQGCFSKSELLSEIAFSKGSCWLACDHINTLCVCRDGVNLLSVELTIKDDENVIPFRGVHGHRGAIMNRSMEE